MKAKKQRKITVVQIRAAEKKLKMLQLKQSQIVKQTTPLKVVIRKYIQQNMQEIEAHLGGKECGMLWWAVDKIKRGYFGDANLQNLVNIIRVLREAGLL